MVDRRFVYTGQIPLDTDILWPQRNMEVAIGALAQAVVGQQGIVPAFAADGFPITQTQPTATLVMNIGAGSVYAQGVVDQTNYGSIPADVTHVTTLQGIVQDTTPLTFTPPGVGGQATNYLVQVAISNLDGTPIVLNYVNASNPLSLTPWSGPNNSGTAQNTVRQCTVAISAKAGVPAAAGSQVTPAPDPGFFGLWVVTVANGATQLTASQVALYASNPFIPATLCGMPAAFQSNKWTYADDTGTANAVVVSLSPAPLSIGKGMSITIKKIASQNTGPATVNVNGGGAVAIRTISGTALVGGEMPPSAMLGLRFDGTFWQLATVSTAGAGGPLFDGDATGTNTYTISNLAPPAGALVNRMMIKATFANDNTGASTLNIGFGSNPIVYANGNPLTGGEITDEHLLTYSTALASWELLTPTIAPPAVQPITARYGPDASTISGQILSTMVPSITSYQSGYLYTVTGLLFACPGASTANFGPGVRNITRADGSACQAGDFTTGQDLVLSFDGTNFQIVNLLSQNLPASAIVQFTTSQSWVVPAGVTRVKRIRVWGAGGGGGGSSGLGGGGSGAGAGGYSEAANFAVVPGASVPVVVGAGGAGGNNTPVNGSAGGTTSFGPCSATGGGAGFAGAGGPQTTFAGSAGTGSGPGLNLTGEGGGFSYPVGASSPAGGTGGASPFGGSIPSPNIFAIGQSGNFPGGGANGGSGGAGGAGAGFGGTGASGLVVIEY